MVKILIDKRKTLVTIRRIRKAAKHYTAMYRLPIRGEKWKNWSPAEKLNRSESLISTKNKSINYLKRLELNR